MNVINEKPNFTPNPTNYIQHMTKPTILHTIELRLNDQEFHRIRLIAAAQNTSPAKVYQNEMRFWIEEGMYDETLTGHDCHWVG